MYVLGIVNQLDRNHSHFNIVLMAMKLALFGHLMMFYMDFMDRLTTTTNSSFMSHARSKGNG